MEEIHPKNLLFWNSSPFENNNLKRRPIISWNHIGVLAQTDHLLDLLDSLQLEIFEIIPLKERNSWKIPTRNIECIFKARVAMSWDEFCFLGWQWGMQEEDYKAHEHQRLGKWSHFQGLMFFEWVEYCFFHNSQAIS